LNAQICLQVNGNETSASDSAGSVHSFVYDYSFWSVDKASGKYMFYSKLVLLCWIKFYGVRTWL